MNQRTYGRRLRLAALTAVTLFLAGGAFAADTIKGQVLGGGAPIAKSTVTLWEASAAAPKQIAQVKTSDDGRFEVRIKGAHGDAVLYLVASGGEPKASKGKGDSTCSCPLVCARERAAGECCRQRTDDGCLRLHCRSIHQRRINLRESAWTQDCCWQRAEPGRSDHRHLGKGAAGSTQ